MKVFRLSTHAPSVAYSMTTLGSSMMNSIFSFYYVKLFLNKYNISEGAFHKSQVVYMIWNAVNDPLFGYLQDNSRIQCCSRRRLSILYGAPFYSLAFLLAWFPWREYEAGDWLSGVHLVIMLCAFDGMLTFVLLAQCALFAEISENHQIRLKLIKYSQVASLIGSSSVLFCGLVSKNMDNFFAFQMFCVFVALLGCACMVYTGFHSESRFDVKAVETSSQQPPLSLAAVATMTREILTNRDFQLFVLMNFFQVFLLAFFNNFAMIFADHLIPADALPSLGKSFMFGAGFICPQLLVLCTQNLLHVVGYYRIILITFAVEAGGALAMLLLGDGHYYCLAVFITVNMILVQAAFSLFNLPLADIIDSDLQKYKRSSPLSSMVFGTNALFTKPAQSLAPMLVVSILNQYGYEEMKDGNVTDQSALEALHSTMFYLVCLVPLCITALQFLSWKPFSIRDSHTTDSKSKRYKAVRGKPLGPDVLKGDEMYKDFSAADIPLVDSAFGKLHEGSPIYQQALSHVIIRHLDAPPPPPLPVAGYRLEPTTCQFVRSHQQHLHLQSLDTTLDMARQIEVSTREQSNTEEWHHVRRPRITSSRFREICHVRDARSAENLARRIRKGMAQTAAMARGLALEPVAIQAYCREQNTNYWPCGFVIHPDAPWLGSSPDGLVFDPTQSPPFGLLEIKCPDAKSYVNCSYLKMQNGSLTLKQSHSYYWQVQGQLLLTGMQWCDFVVFAKEDILIQRIYRDCEVAKTIREKGDHFFFYFYMTLFAI